MKINQMSDRKLCSKSSQSSAASPLVMETSEDSELCFPQLLNASCVKTKRPHYETLLTNIAVASVSLLTVFLNLLVIISISHFKQLHTPTNFILLSLAVSDFFMGVLMFFQIMLIDGCWYLGDLICSMYQYLAFINSSTSAGAMVLISIDRYLAVCHPLLYSTQVTQTRAQLSVYLCWVCSLIFQTLNLQDVLHQPGRFNSCVGECAFVINYVSGLADLLFTFIVPITVIMVLYVRVFVVAVSQARAIRSHIAAVSLQRSGKVSRLSELKATRTLGVVIVVFLLCLSPYYCVALSGGDTLLNGSTAAFVICLYYLNSCLNPLIYAFLYPWFKKSVQLIVTCRILQPDSSAANVM